MIPHEALTQTGWNRRRLVAGLLMAGAAPALLAAKPSPPTRPMVRSRMRPKLLPARPVEVFDPRLLDLVDADSGFDVISTNHTFTEGPVWDDFRGRLYFTDIPANRVHRWSEREGTRILLDPANDHSDTPDGERTDGANGLAMTANGRLVLANHGHRNVETFDPDTGARQVLAERYRGRRFSSPNDLAFGADDSLFFTDAVYGLKGGLDSERVEMDEHAVYRLRPGGEVERWIDGLTMPNGLSFAPDFSALYVSETRPAKPVVHRFALGPDHRVESRETIARFQPFMDDGYRGICDGMCMAASGHVFQGGPGGVYVLAPDGAMLGRLNTGRLAANCAFGEDGRSLFVTAHELVLRLRTRIGGAHIRRAPPGWTPAAP